MRAEAILTVLAIPLRVVKNLRGGNRQPKSLPQAVRYRNRLAAVASRQLLNGPELLNVLRAADWDDLHTGKRPIASS